MTIRAISVAALAALLLGALGGCVMATAPSCPAAAALLAPSTNPPPPAAAPPVPPVSAVPPEPAAPLSPALPASSAPVDGAPQQFSGSSTAPSAGRTAARRGDRRRPAGRHRGWNLDETQIEAQWVNPPVGAGE